MAVADGEEERAAKVEAGGGVAKAGVKGAAAVGVVVGVGAARGVGVAAGGSLGAAGENRTAAGLLLLGEALASLALQRMPRLHHRRLRRCWLPCLRSSRRLRQPLHSPVQAPAQLLVVVVPTTEEQKTKARVAASPQYPH